jgi:hypothetical protein
MHVYNCEEYDLVQNVFVPFFENRGLSVFMEDRDMTPGRSRTSAISEAVQLSRSNLRSDQSTIVTFWSQDNGGETVTLFHFITIT